MSVFSIFFKNSKNEMKYIGSINENEFYILKPFFKEFSKNTGMIIDEYKKNIIHNDSLSILINCFKEKNENIDKKSKEIVEKYRNLFELIYENQYDLILYGN